MGFEKGRGLGKNLQGRALPIRVERRQGKGAVGRYGNEDPNRVIPTEGNQYSSSLFQNPSPSYLEPSESKASSKKNAGPSAPQWRKQQREVRTSATVFRIFSRFDLESTKTTICLSNIK